MSLKPSVPESCPVADAWTRFWQLIADEAEKLDQREAEKRQNPRQANGGD